MVCLRMVVASRNFEALLVSQAPEAENQRKNNMEHETRVGGPLGDDIGVHVDGKVLAQPPYENDTTLVRSYSAWDTKIRSLRTRSQTLNPKP